MSKLQWHTGGITFDASGTRVKARMAELGDGMVAIQLDNGHWGFYAYADHAHQDPIAREKTTLPIAKTLRGLSAVEQSKIDAQAEFNRSVEDIRFKMSCTLPAQPEPQAITPSPFHRASSDIATIVVKG
jgi:hypothetical protein